MSVCPVVVNTEYCGDALVDIGVKTIVVGAVVICDVVAVGVGVTTGTEETPSVYPTP